MSTKHIHARRHQVHSPQTSVNPLQSANARHSKNTAAQQRILKSFACSNKQISAKPPRSRRHIT